MADLLPCPFCGGPATMSTFAIRNGVVPIVMTHIECGRDDECQACADVQNTDEATAIRVWNTRAPFPSTDSGAK